MNPIDHLPPYLRDAARKLPKGQQHTVLDLPEEGDGHNAGLLKVASICYRMGVSMEDTLSHLQDIYHQDRIDWRTAPQRAVKRVWQYEGEVPSDSDGDDPIDGTLQDDLLLRFRRTSASEIKALSPHKTTTHPKDIIRGLFDAGDIVNMQHTGREAGTLVKVSDLPDDISTYKFLNPSIFKKIDGVEVEQPDGSTKTMTRCNANVKSRPFMVLEFDYRPDDPDGIAKLERFSTFVLALAQFVPLVMAVDTGGKSIHFWFDTRQAKKGEMAHVFALAVMHGADKRLSVKSQIARMPNVSSAGEGRGPQRVIYYDPEMEKTPDGAKWNVKGLEDYLLKARQLDYYYDDGKSRYFMQSNSDRWISLNRQSLGKHLVMQGFRDTKLETETISPVDEIIATIEADRSVEAVLKGASGKHAGFYEDNGFSYLVLKSPALIRPRKGDWSTIRAYLEHAMRSDLAQVDLLNASLSASIKAFRNGDRRQSNITPCQAIHICGDGNSGKTFFAKFILPPLFGNRWANATPYFDPRGSDFNSEMFGAELLILDDSYVLEANHNARHIMTEKIKEITVGSGEGYHGKFGDRITARPWWRLWRFLNTTPENLATLPLIDEAATDKWMLLHWQTMAGGSVDTSKPGWFEPWKDQIVKEVPAYLHFLLYEFVAPAHTKDPSGRYPTHSYKNPTLMDSLREDSLETHLIHRIDTDAHEALFARGFDDDTVTWWEGTAAELYDVLSGAGTTASQRRFAKTCPSPRVLSAQLKILEKEHPGRVVYSGREGVTPVKKRGNYYWIIRPAELGEVAPVAEDDCF